MFSIALVSLAAAFVVLCCVAVCGCACTWRRYFARRQVHDRLTNHVPPGAHRRSGQRRSRPAFGGCCGRSRPERIEKPKETPLEFLQRRFVSGEIGLDEYERDVDRTIQGVRPA